MMPIQLRRKTNRVLARAATAAILLAFLQSRGMVDPSLSAAELDYSVTKSREALAHEASEARKRPEKGGDTIESASSLASTLRNTDSKTDQ